MNRALLVALWVVAGCSGTGSTDFAPECEATSDCDTGEECNAGVCIPDSSECRIDAHCIFPPECSTATGATCVEGTCEYPASTCAAGIACTGTGQCDAGLQCNQGLCCDVGAALCCTDNGNCAGGFACNVADFTCFDSCTDGDSSRCANSGEVCVANVCSPQLADGTACSGDSSCASGFCVDGVCCDSACDSVCESCIQADTGGGDGGCAPLSAGCATSATNLTQLGVGAAVSQFAVSTDGARVLFVADRQNDTAYVLESVARDGSAGATLSAAIGSTGDVVEARMTPDGTKTVFLADTITDGVFELFWVPTAGGTPIALQTGLTANSQRDGWQLTDTNVLFVGDSRLASVNELFAISLTTGVQLPLHPALVAGRSVTDFLLSPSADRVLYRANTDSPGVFQLFAVNLDASLAVEINADIALRTVDPEFAFTPDGTRVVYRSHNNGSGDYSLSSANAFTANTPLSLTPVLPAERVVAPSFWLSNQHAVYRADVFVEGVLDLAFANLDTAAGLALSPLPFGATSGPVVLSPLGDHAVFTTDDLSDGVFRLLAATVPGGAVTELWAASPSAAPGRVVISPAGTHAIYVANALQSDRVDLFAGPLSGGTSVRLNGDASVKHFEVSAQGRVLYTADENTSNAVELFSVAIDGTGRVRLNDGMVAGGDVVEFLATTDGGVVWLADTITRGVFDVFSKTDVMTPGERPTETAALPALLGPNLLVRYSFAEQSAGQPALASAIVDEAVGPVNLNLNPSANVAYTTGGGGRGLRWFMRERGGGPSVNVGTTKIATDLSGANAITIETVVEIAEAGRRAPIVRVGDGTVDAFALFYDHPRRTLRFAFNAAAGVLCPVDLVKTGRTLVHVVVDLQRNTAEERVACFINGVARPTLSAPPLALPSQGATMTVPANALLTVGNSPTVANSISGAIYYLALYTHALDAEQLEVNSEYLLSRDD